MADGRRHWGRGSRPDGVAGKPADLGGSLTRRTALLSAGGLGVFGVLGARLHYLQVTEAENYAALSEDNRFNHRITVPSRGRILDRHGEVLADSELDYGVTVVPEAAPSVEGTLDRLSEIVTISDRTRERVLAKTRRQSRFVPVMVAEHLDWSDFSAVNLRLPELPGVQPEVSEGRHYPEDGIFSHVLGYVGRPVQRDLDASDDPLLRQPTFWIGKTGVEASMDEQLRGEAGRLKVEVNSSGRVVREWPEDGSEAKAGKDVYLTLDAGLQRFAAEQFGEESGGIALMDVQTGELRTLLSMPTYDANKFVSGLTQAELDALNSDERRPQYNKVVAGGYPPASTFKMVVMAGALQSGLVNPASRVTCNGSLRLGRRIFHCWKRGGHGSLDMRGALQKSCDVYFYTIIQQLGMEWVEKAGLELGLGQAYDIGVGGQNPGILPTPAWKEAYRGQPWTGGDALNASIGQGFVLANPLHLAVMTARIANGRKKVMPSLTITGEPLEFEDLDLDARTTGFIQDAMYSVTAVPGGTAYRADPFGLGIPMAGKTGTGQVRGISLADRRSGRYKDEVPWRFRDHKLFVGYAPYDTPRYACAAIVEHGAETPRIAISIVNSVLGEALRRDGYGQEAKAGTPGSAGQ